MDLRYWRTRRIFGIFLIKLAYAIIFGRVPSKLEIRIQQSGCSGQLVIKLSEEARYELKQAEE